MTDKDTELLKKAVRAALDATQGPHTDEEFEIRWKFNPDPEHVRLGGPWYLLQVAQIVLEVFKKDRGEAQ
jgi:hypothetical protein